MLCDWSVIVEIFLVCDWLDEVRVGKCINVWLGKCVIVCMWNEEKVFKMLFSLLG